MHERARRRDADLPAVQQEPARAVRDGVVQVRVVEDQRRRLAAELERHALHVGRRRGGLDPAPRRGGAGEGDFGDARVVREERARGAGAGHDVDDARREARLGDEVAEGEQPQGRFFGRLVDDGVAGGDGGGDFPGEGALHAYSSTPLSSRGMGEGDNYVALAFHAPMHAHTPSGS